MKFKLLLFLFFCFSLESAGQMRIVCIGNSITQGKSLLRADNTYEFSYRPWLWEKLVQDGFKVDMVGYHPYFFEEKGDKLNLEFKTKTGKKFDRDSEAYYGIKSDGFVNGSASAGWTGRPLPAFRNRINDPEKGYTPDFALIHLGTNDADSTQALVAATRQNLEEIIRVLREKNPQVVVLLAKLITGWKKINPEIENICAKLSTPQSPVIMVDMATGFINDPKLPGTMTYDYVHPNTVGQKFMTERWYQALINNLNDKIKPQIPGALVVKQKTNTSATLTWPIATDNYGIKNYEIYADKKRVGTVPATGQTTFTATNLKSGTNYSFKVVAKDLSGNYSAPVITRFNKNK
jgi:lysophospholipase L1-like esterase